MNRRQLVITIIVSVLIFTGFVLSRFPAANALALAGRYSGLVFANNASGTIWQGKADNLYLTINQELLDLGRTQWQLSPWHLFIGKISIKLTAVAGDQRIKADVLAGFSSVHLRDTQVAVDMQRLLQFYPLPIRLQGQLDLDVQEAKLTREGITALAGNMVVKDVVFTFQRPVNLGTFGARLGMDGDFVTADVSDIDATVKVEGRLMASLAKREYRNKLLINPTPVADLSVSQTLQMVAKKQADGSFQFEHNGNF